MKTAVVTGATSGIGLSVCRKLAGSGFDIIGIGRNEETCGKATDTLRSEFPKSNVRFFCADFSRQSEVLLAGKEIKEYVVGQCDGKIDVLISNAGCVRGYYMTTEDGYETQFAVNHLAGFLLTYILMTCLIDGNGRIIMTSSGSHKRMKMHWKDIMFKHRYNPLLAYKQSKLANMLFAYDLNERFGRYGISAYGVDPGLVNTDIGFKNTNVIVRLVWKMRQRSGVSPDIPAETYAYICCEENAPKGLYYYLCKEEKYNKEVNKSNADRLWKISEQLCGIVFGRDAVS